MTYEKEAFLSDFVHTLALDYDVTPEEADIFQIHYTIAKLILGGLSTDIKKSRDAHNKKRRACYFSAEFLVGRAVYNNILCLGLTDTVNEAMKLCGKTLADFEEIEDAALGNGGLGRLAACFLDSAATLNLPLDGYGIRYKYGLFKQEFHDGFQVETADDWAIHGGAWSRRRDKDTVRVEFADQVVNAVPYDMPIMGYHTKNVGNLRLWQAESLTPFDFNLFNAQQYDNAVREKNRAEDISRVLYPNDDTWEGKVLRLKQQYFFCCASITDLLKDYQKYHGDNFLEFGKYFAVQLNDTHPVIAIPELVRQLTQYHGLDFEQALGVCHQVFGYTNHTIMSEALEKWPCDLMRSVVPQILDIIMQINNMLNDEMRYMKLTGEEIGRLQIVNDNMVHMARLAIYVSSYTNGVARIHTEILKHNALKEWYFVYPERFQNKTNGVTQRRWFALCNPELFSFVCEKLGNDRVTVLLKEIKAMEQFADDPAVIQRFMEIKHANKKRLCDFIETKENVRINPNSIFDVQVKRLHEYKRQLLNAFSILYLYYGIKDGSITDFYPTTFIFGAKSAPGYRRAKGIIKFINEIANLVNNDPQTKDILKVVFVCNYNVSYAEKLVAAADVSVQISTAGTEASGTGNMKFMMNGAVTLGTLDGANVEIVEEAGEENNYIFGAKVEELGTIMQTYNPKGIYDCDEKIRRVVDTLVNGTLNDGGSGLFREIYDSLLYGAGWTRPDNYYVLGDLNSFVETRLRLNRDYQDREAFAKKCYFNMANSGKFSSDRTIRHYSTDIWNIEPVDINW
ncbi:MAG: glycogen/starch/alpha-glucan phosphorylase [Oscillospiraceae bacterium]|nr:glycogen/starch/alpha-glucan phosphorylase [Oscillospiraceae bacterium]MDY3065403.1 glycogen/starch/alpha-glucan phosphorylase [Oscillospiraceae bacterium]